MARNTPPDEPDHASASPGRRNAERTSEWTPLAASLESIAASLHATQEGLAECLDVASRRAFRPDESSLPHPGLRVVIEVAHLLESCHERLVRSLETLPGEPQYGPYVTRLRAAAEGNAELKALLDEAPRLGIPLRDALLALSQVADEIETGRVRLQESARILALDAPIVPSDAFGRTLSQLREIVAEAAARHEEQAQAAAALPTIAGLQRELETLAGSLRGAVAETAAQRDAPAPPSEVPALAALKEEMETLVASLREAVAEMAARRDAPAEPPEGLPAVVSLRADLEGLEASLRAASTLAAPLVASLSALAQEAERLRSPEAPSSARPAPVHEEAVGEWAGQILSAVRDLAQAVAAGSPTDAAQEQRLWDNVRDLHLEIVHLKGALLTRGRRTLPDDLG